MTCPACESSDVRLASRHHVEDWLMILLGCNTYRCRECRNRFHGFRWWNVRSARARSARHGSRRFRFWRDRHFQLFARRLALTALTLAALYLFFRFISRPLE